MTTNLEHEQPDPALIAGFQLRSPHRPLELVEPTSPAACADAVGRAVRAGHRIAVQGTGHGRSRGADGVVLIATRRLDELTVDPDRRVARVGAGVTWGAVIAAAARHGLAPLSGSFPGVGVVGYTLGGGFGLLSRRYGYAADRVRAIELVTVDGRLRRVTATSTGAEAELFWGLRGGGGAAAVVTGIEIDLFPVASVVGGAVTFDLAADPTVMAAWRAWAADQSDDALLAATVLPVPDVPAVPAALRGRQVARLQVCWPGPLTAGIARSLDRLRGLGQPLTDTVRQLPYAESGSIFAEPDVPHAYRGSGWLVDDLPAPALAELPRRSGPGAGAMCVVGIRRLGGAMARQPAEPNAVGHRDAGWSVSVLSPVDTDAEQRVDAVHDRILRPLRTAIIGRALNLTYRPLAPDEAAEGYDRDALPRLRRLRDRLDPERMIIANHPL